MSEHHAATGRDRFTALATAWAAVTVLYGTALAGRWSVAVRAPGLGSAAGIGAVSAVWLHLLVWRRQTRQHGWSPGLTRIAAGLLLVLAATLAANVVVVIRGLREDGSPPLASMISTFAFTLVLRHVIVDMLGAQRQGGEPD
ncbi:MAG: hypothetical protein ABW277_19825 [Longimicrobiaceae bacterium]